jgi:hypothetical protein
MILGPALSHIHIFGGISKGRSSSYEHTVNQPFEAVISPSLSRRHEPIQADPPDGHLQAR